MTSITIPAPVVGHLRCALLSELGDAGVLIGQASFEYEKEKHPDLFAEPVKHFDAYRALLDVIAWGEPPDEQSMEIHLDLHRYLLRGIARCERCQGKMHGTAIGTKLAARYYCSTRRASHTCDQPLIHADRVEAQLVEFIADFKPHPAIREEILWRLAGSANTDTTETAKRRADLEERLRRARDLYELGDLTRPEYMARREAINTELASTAPDPLPDLNQAQQVLEDFSIFWLRETDPAAKRQLLSLVFQRVWLDEQRVVAVQPKPSFAPYFENPPLETAGKGVCKERERRDSNPRPPA